MKVKSLSKEGVKPAAPRSTAAGIADRSSTGNGTHILPPIPVDLRLDAYREVQGAGASALKSRSQGTSGGRAAHALLEGRWKHSLPLGWARAGPAVPFCSFLGFASFLHPGLCGLGSHRPINVGGGNDGKCSPDATSVRCLSQVQPHFPACPAFSVAFAGARVGAGLQPGRRVPTAAAAVRTRRLGGSLVPLFESQRLPHRGLRECPRLPSAEEPRGALWSGDANPGCDLGGEQMPPGWKRAFLRGLFLLG